MGHRLMLHRGKCANYHGHRYALLATLGSDELNPDDMVIDFDSIKPLAKGWIDDNLDHAMVLHRDDPLAVEMSKIAKVTLLPFHPTAERLVGMLAANLIDVIYDASDGAVKLTGLVLYETPNCSASWHPRQLSLGLGCGGLLGDDK
jgi:6-pyruvoyltetrahydropterin/6-carboxytetrahydropterin synthase